MNSEQQPFLLYLLFFIYLLYFCLNRLKMEPNVTTAEFLGKLFLFFLLDEKKRFR